MKIKLKIWRQKGPSLKGRLVNYELDNVSPNVSFLEMMDMLNDKLIKSGEAPVVFDHDCREGICGACSMVINGVPHGPADQTTTCQLHMRKFHEGQTIVIEPFRAKAFPVVRDLMVDRSSFDKVIAAGGFISVDTGSAPEANGILIPKPDADYAMDAAQCIGCGACVAACKNASAMLFVSAKVSHLASLPQGRVEAKERVQSMVKAMDEAGFGHCSNEGECSAVCPKGVEVSHIAKLNREFLFS